MDDLTDPALSSLLPPSPSSGARDEEDEEIGRVAGVGVVPWGRLPFCDCLLWARAPPLLVDDDVVERATWPAALVVAVSAVRVTWSPLT